MMINESQRRHKSFTGCLEDNDKYASHLSLYKFVGQSKSKYEDTFPTQQYSDDFLHFIVFLGFGFGYDHDHDLSHVICYDCDLYRDDHAPCL
jgi:hypothetical protein